jgi:hypothetical protein
VFFKKLKGCPEKRKKRKKKKKRTFFRNQKKKYLSLFPITLLSLSLSFSDYKKTSLKRRALEERGRRTNIRSLFPRVKWKKRRRAGR